MLRFFGRLVNTTSSKNHSNFSYNKEKLDEIHLDCQKLIDLELELSILFELKRELNVLPFVAPAESSSEVSATFLSDLEAFGMKRETNTTMKASEFYANMVTAGLFMLLHKVVTLDDSGDDEDEEKDASNKIAALNQIVNIYLNNMMKFDHTNAENVVVIEAQVNKAMDAVQRCIDDVSQYMKDAAFALVSHND